MGISPKTLFKLTDCNMFAFTQLISKLPQGVKIGLTLLLFLMVTLPRFNRNSIIVERPLNDARYFIAYVEYFRGETPSDVIRPASNWRMLVPMAASLLPFDPLTSINLINLLCFGIALFYLFRSSIALEIPSALAWLSCWLSIVSFPGFYYTTIGYVDPGALLFIAAGTYFTINGKLVGVLICLIAGTFAKETIGLLIPFYAGYHYLRQKQRTIWITIILMLFFGATNVLIRQYAYITPGANNPGFWGFSMDAFYLNAKRFNSYAAPLLSLGVPALLFCFSLYRSGIRTAMQTPIMLATLLSFCAALSLTLLVSFATVVDGRTLWMVNGMLLLASLSYLAKKYDKISF